MLPVFSLDDENFDTILNKAIDSIGKYQKEWTNYNPSDSGIVLLELFSWLQEMQRFYLEQNGMENEALYLELLGVEPTKRSPSEIVVQLLEPEPVKIHKNTGFYTEDFCFEPERAIWFDGEKIQDCYVQKADGKLLWRASSEDIRFGKWMFGEKPQTGDCFFIGFDRPVRENQVHALYWILEEPKGEKRNPFIAGEDPHFSDYRLEYWDGDAWNECTVLTDETHGFLQSGFIYWQAATGLHEVENKYWLRIRLTFCEFDLPPRIKGIETQRVRLLQKETIAASMYLTLPEEEDGIYHIDLQDYFEPSEEVELFVCRGGIYERQELLFLENDKLEFQYKKKRKGKIEVLLTIRQKTDRTVSWEATGFPYQVIDLQDSNIIGSRLQVLVEREDAPGTYRLWKQVSHFWKAGSYEECYCFQEKEGVLLFGDGEHGKIPEGRILLIDCVRTFGADGRIKEGENLKWKNGTVFNPQAAVSGTQPESSRECLLSVTKRERNIQRAITNEDYEVLVKQTPGLLIHRVKAISDEQDKNSITIIIETGMNKQHSLSPVYQQQVLKWLEKKRMIGTHIRLQPPVYIPIQVFAELEVHKGFSQAEAWVRNEIKDFFQIHMKSFGATFQYSQLYGTIDRIRCVAAIRNLTVTAQGKDILYQKNKNFLLPKQGLAVLDEVSIQWVRSSRS